VAAVQRRADGVSPTSPARRQPLRLGHALLIAFAGLAVAGCGAGDAATERGAQATATTEDTTTTSELVDGSLSDVVRPLPPAVAFPAAERPVAAPVALDIAALQVDAVPIVAVGLEPNGEMEIPEVDEVGWYRYSAHPGDPGTAVLAAHIAYDGVDGVFRHLADLAPGDEVAVRLDGGDPPLRFVIDEIARYPKTELPQDVWARTGPPRLALITCGGDFDPTTRHYTDNVVAWASPRSG